MSNIDEIPVPAFGRAIAETERTLFLLFCEIFLSPWRVMSYVAPSPRYRYRVTWSSFDWFCFLLCCAFGITVAFSIYNLVFADSFSGLQIEVAFAVEVILFMVCSAFIEFADEDADDN